MRAVLFVYIFLIFSQVQAKSLSINAGEVLLNTFQCDNVGQKTNQVRQSLQNLRDAVNSLEEDKDDCKGVMDTVADLPSIENVLDNIYTDGVGEEIRKQEGLINEALADLARTRGLSAEERLLYPAEDDLRFTITTARSTLYELRARLGIEESQLKREKYIKGVEELNSLGGRIANALDANHSCFEKHPSLRQQALTGLVGITGFFMNEPLGIATTSASRLLQQVFRITGSRKKDFRRAFEPTRQAELVVGLSCTLQNLNKQHCKLTKEEALAATLTEGGICTECNSVMAWTEQQRKNLEDIEQLKKWTAARDTVDVTSEDMEVKSSAKQRVLAGIAKSQAELNRSKSTVRRMRAGPARNDFVRDSALNALMPFALLVNTTNIDRTNENYEYVDNNAPTAEERVQIRANLTSSEVKIDVLNMIYGDDIDRNREFSQLESEYNKFFGGDTRANFKSGYSLATRIIEENVPGESADRLRKTLSDESILHKIKTRLQAFETDAKSRLDTELTQDKLDQLTIQFYSGSSDESYRVSPYESLKNIDAFLSSIPSSFLNSPAGRFSRVQQLSGEVQTALALAARIRTKPQVTQEDQVALKDTVSGLIGENQEFFQRLNSLSSRLTQQQQREIRDHLQSADNNQARELLFYINQDVVKSALSLSEAVTISQKGQDLKQAKALSASQLDAFTGYFTGYLSKAFNFASKKKGLRKGLKENIDPSLRSHLCIHLLGMTDLKKEITDECSGTEINSQGIRLKFDDYKEKPHTERVCAYENFIQREKVKETKARGVR